MVIFHPADRSRGYRVFLAGGKKASERTRKQPVIILSRRGCSICRRASASSPASPPSKQLGNSLASLPPVLTPFESWHPWSGRERSARGCDPRDRRLFSGKYFRRDAGERIGNSRDEWRYSRDVDGYFWRVSFYRARRGIHWASERGVHVLEYEFFEKRDSRKNLEWILKSAWIDYSFTKNSNIYIVV